MVNTIVVLSVLEKKMTKYPMSHMIRIKRVTRIRVAWLQRIGSEVAKLERVAREAKKLVKTPVCGI